MLPARPADGHLQAQVQGRSDESFRYGAVSVHPFVITVASAAKMRRSLLRR